MKKSNITCMTLSTFFATKALSRLIRSSLISPNSYLPKREKYKITTFLILKSTARCCDLQNDNNSLPKYQCQLLLTFSNSLDPDQVQHNLIENAMGSRLQYSQTVDSPMDAHESENAKYYIFKIPSKNSSSFLYLKISET